MSRELAIRAMSVYGPMALIAGVWAVRRVTRREAIAAVLATIWTLISLAVVHVIAVDADWWRFTVTSVTLPGFMLPTDLYVGWALLWGALPVLAAARLPLVAVVVVLLGLDLVLMPLCEPVVRLGPQWLVGEGVAIVISLVPAQLLARWTLFNRQLAGRATLQVIGFSTFMLWLLPSLILAQMGESWEGLTSRGAQACSLALQALAIPAVLGLGAVCEFVTRGRGTPVPFDPPRRLVTTGPYAYVANPMQLSMTLVFLGWGALLASWWVTAAGAMAVVYSAGLAAWDEGGDLRARFGPRWTAYRRHVRAWWPRWRPFVMPGESRARLYVAAGCGQCSTIGRWFARQRPIGLTIVAAEEHPTRDLWRMTYDPGDGSPDEEGIAAFARALEHIHFAWALAGMTMRLPLVRPLLQTIIDASGGGPQRIRRTASYCPR
jgi:protein-S-isoprenylcysteine O-methyltransferase Ste14